MKTMKYTGGGASEVSTIDGISVPPHAVPSGIHARDPVPIGRGGSVVSPSQNYTNVKNSLGGRLYEDPEFPAVDESLYYSLRPPQKFEWKRPHEISGHPEFISDGTSRFDVRQGELGNCWLIAAVACLSLNADSFDQVVPINQSFTKPDYCGMFRFRFWRFGVWKEVLVDDRLPTYNNNLVYMHSTETNEFWSALLEKAYAKLYGTYEALIGGLTSEALEDFTGGITESFDLNKDPPKNLFEIMLKALDRCSFMCCSTETDLKKTDVEFPNGLITGHAYSITDVKMVNINIPGKFGKIQLIRIRNPWGNEAEWKGTWCDKSPEWNFISATDRQSMGLTFDDDGEFWMSFQDFIKNFEDMDICHLGPQSLEVNQIVRKSRWEMCVENGEWKKRLNAGGCRNFLDTFWTNPQFRVTVFDPDEGDDDLMGTIIVGLMQKDMRKRRKDGEEFYTIGYAIYKLKDANQGPLDLKFFKFNKSIAKPLNFENHREVCGRHKLPPGAYCIVPSTFEPNQEAGFLLRIFSEKPNESGEMDEKTYMAPTEQANPINSSLMRTCEPEKAISPRNDAQVAALRELFNHIAGQDLEIDAYELQDVLNTAFKRDFPFDGFSIETSKSMVAMMDYDQSGKLGFDEFKVLWTDLRLYKTAFKKFDLDKSGNFNSYELRHALNSVGFSLSNKIFNSLVMRFSDKDGLVKFDDYILCCVRLKTIFETYKSQPHDPNGRAIFEKDTFIQCISYV